MAADLQLAYSGLLGAIGVASAALGAHYMKRTLSADGSHAFRTAGHYSSLVSLATLALRALIETQRNISAARLHRLDAAVNLLLIGATLFSGSIFWLCLKGPWVLGSLTPYLTPLGGSFMVSGFLTASSAALMA